MSFWRLNYIIFGTSENIAISDKTVCLGDEGNDVTMLNERDGLESYNQFKSLILFRIGFKNMLIFKSLLRGIFD
jgi:hypothetical protein